MRIIIETKERHRNLFIEMAKAVKAKVQIEEEEKDRPPTKEEFLDNLERSFRQAELHSQGKIQLSTLKEFLDEL
jgi:lipoate-protein ligase A